MVASLGLESTEGSGSHSHTGGKARGLQQWGLDSLDLSLDALQMKTEDPKTNTNTTTTGECGGGGVAVPTSATTTISSSSSSSYQEKKRRLKEQENIRAAMMTTHAPKCPGHGLPAKLNTVKKTGRNKVWWHVGNSDDTQQ